MSNVELQYIQEREGGFSPESKPVETYLGDDGTSPLHQAAHPQIVTRAELGISYSGAASDGSGRGSAPRTGISPEHLDVSAFISVYMLLIILYNMGVFLMSLMLKWVLIEHR